jgi:hypothetical protein
LAMMRLTKGLVSREIGRGVHGRTVNAVGS